MPAHLYPEIRVELVVTNEDLDLAMREAHIARPEADATERYGSKSRLNEFAGEERLLVDLEQDRARARTRPTTS